MRGVRGVSGARGIDVLDRRRSFPVIAQSEGAMSLTELLHRSAVGRARDINDERDQEEEEEAEVRLIHSSNIIEDEESCQNRGALQRSAGLSVSPRGGYGKPCEESLKRTRNGGGVDRSRSNP